MTLRPFVALAAAWLLTFAVAERSPVRGAEPAGSYPYFAYVVGSDVHLRSGPGMQYYPTERLSQGVEVEVYRADPGGWLAVRPTERSYSWVLAKYVRAASADEGIIVGDGVVARTGSSLSDVRDVIQVQLAYGEKVRILGVREFGEGRARESWVQIAPPAGEFRWISDRDVKRAPTQVAAAAPPPRRAVPEAPARPAPERPRAERAPQREVEERVEEVAYETEAAREPVRAREASTTREAAPPPAATSPDGWKTSSGPPPKKKTREPVVRADFNEADRDLEEPRREASSTGRSFDDAFAGAVAPQRRLQHKTNADEADRLAALQTDVAREAARETEEWDFDDLYEEARSLIEHGEQSYVRKRAREICDQIERFEDIRDRRRRITEESAAAGAPPQRDERVQLAAHAEPARPKRTTDGVERAAYEEPADAPQYNGKALRYDDQPITEPSPKLATPSRVAPRPAPAPAAAPTETADDPRFDAVGVLTPIIAVKVGDPTYALLDDRGEVVAFVAPAPGVSLRRCVGERIGVVGSTTPSTQLGGKSLVVVRRAAPVAK